MGETGDEQSFARARAAAADALAQGRTLDLPAIAELLAAIAGRGEYPEAAITAAELYALLPDFMHAEDVLERSRAAFAGDLIDHRLEGLRLLRTLGDRLTAIALSAGRLTARHTQASPRERAQLEKQMNALELALEGAGLDLDKVEGGFDLILETYWGAHHNALFRLALGLETLLDDLFPALDRVTVAGTAKQSFDYAQPLLRALAGGDLTDRLRVALATTDLERIGETARALFDLIDIKLKGA